MPVVRCPISDSLQILVREHSEPTFADHGAVNYVHRSPVGCVGLITPWNLPLYLLTWKVAPALLMGNTIVAKPSELTPMTANHLAKTLDAIGFQKGSSTVVHGLGPEVGQAIVEHPDIRGISFTGGTATGKIVAVRPHRCSRNSPWNWEERTPPSCWTMHPWMRSWTGWSRARSPTLDKCVCAVPSRAG